MNEKIKSWIHEACLANNVPEYSKKITYSFSDRMSKTMGMAYPKDNYIVFSSRIWNKATIEQQKENVIHEACHLIAVHKYGQRGHGHGRPWQHCMKQAGFIPNRFHDVITERQYIVKCKCTRTLLSKTKAKELYEAKATCTICNSNLKYKAIYEQH